MRNSGRNEVSRRLSQASEILAHGSCGTRFRRHPGPVVEEPRAMGGRNANCFRRVSIARESARA
jgi:hypothetical protein